MAHPLEHAKNSARKFGGAAEDYLPIHEWFDESKAMLADVRHRERPIVLARCADRRRHDGGRGRRRRWFVVAQRLPHRVSGRRTRAADAALRLCVVSGERRAGRRWRA